MTANPDKTSELLQAVLAANDERKFQALRVLRGELSVGNGQKTGSSGPLLMGMSAGARFLGVSRATLWRVVRAGKIQKVELFPGSFRVRRDDLEALAFGRIAARVRRTEVREQTFGKVNRDSVRNDPRFQQLMALADEDDGNAAADLYKEFGYEYELGRFEGEKTAGTVGRGGKRSASCADASGRVGNGRGEA